MSQVKNSLRAVNDRFEDADNEPPPVRVVVAEGDEDVTIKVCFSHHLHSYLFAPVYAQAFQHETIPASNCWHAVE